jgi:hypothetical protein
MNAVIPNPPQPPDVCDIAFKEWAGICHALAEGRQSLILRKGGIAEQGSRFTPDHDRFWLFPTHTHQQYQGLRESAPALDAGSELAIDTLVEVDQVARLTQLDQVHALAPFYLWTEETIEARFQYREPGLWLLLVRVRRLAHPVIVAGRSEFRGCHTWVPLPDPISLSGLVPVLSEAEHRTRLDAIEGTLLATGTRATHE